MNDKKEKSFEKKQELINAALKEFSEKGYENASLNNILKEAGISKGTFYYHFSNKEDLYFYLISILIEEKKKFFNKHIKSEDFNKDIFTLLGSFTKAGLEFARQNPDINKFSHQFLKERGNPIHDKALERFNVESDDFFSFLIENAYEKGDLREDLPKAFVKRLIAYLFSHIHEITDIVDVEDYEDAANNLVEFLKYGLTKRDIM